MDRGGEDAGRDEKRISASETPGRSASPCPFFIPSSLIGSLSGGETNER